MNPAPAISDRDRHKQLLEQKAKLKEQAGKAAEKKPGAEPMITEHCVERIPKGAQVVRLIQTTTTKKVWACSNCEGCEGFVRGPRAGKCKSCRCDLLHHLREEEEYGDHCLGT